MSSLINRYKQNFLTLQKLPTLLTHNCDNFDSSISRRPLLVSSYKITAPNRVDLNPHDLNFQLHDCRHLTLDHYPIYLSML